MYQKGLFAATATAPEASELGRPNGYSGLAAFHKYWGKKPTEALAYLIAALSKEGDIVLDPFLGSALIVRETLTRRRRFIGIDVNPIAIELANMFADPPSLAAYSKVLRTMEDSVKGRIYETYRLADGGVGSHYLWDGETLSAVWEARPGERGRVERTPSDHDRDLATMFKGYESVHMRNLKFFTNSRINAHNRMNCTDIFTARALRNIDLLMEGIPHEPVSLRRALLLTLTSAVGQMSNMVFAIQKRGKNNGTASTKTEVGSWVVGFWRPRLHFEVNVWNCFHNRARKLIQGIREGPPCGRENHLGSIREVLEGGRQVALVNEDMRKAVAAIPSGSVKLVLTDPPHGDRIPYLEMSEIWNALLGCAPDFEGEVVVSDAVGRGKNLERFNRDMAEVMAHLARVLCPGGTLAVIFNGREDDSWDWFQTLNDAKGELLFRGCFPLRYSASSVVQDNRKGALKHDFVLIYSKAAAHRAPVEDNATLRAIPGWRDEFPRKAAFG